MANFHVRKRFIDTFFCGIFSGFLTNIKHFKVNSKRRRRNIDDFNVENIYEDLFVDLSRCVGYYFLIVSTFGISLLIIWLHFCVEGGS